MICNSARSLLRILPVIMIMTPFGIISGYYGLVEDANHCSCW